MYLSEAVRQIFSICRPYVGTRKKPFPSWMVEGMQDHPAFHWGRANGWALLTMCEVLDVLPEDYPQRDKILSCSVLMYVVLLPARVVKVSGISCWIVTILIWKPRPRLFMYIAFAHAINKGWIDAMAYGPVAQLGWHAVTTQINAEGQVDGTCVGTGMAF